MTTDDRPILAVLKALLRHVRRCGVCSRPATYSRALCDICDVCAADPLLDWDGDDPGQFLLAQARDVRAARKLIEQDGREKQ